MLIDEYAFDRTKLGNAEVFKIPNVRVSPTFVTRPFVDWWESAGLTGLSIKRIRIG